MKRKLIWILGIEAVVCVVLCILGQTPDSAITSVMAFPFEQIGNGLRALSTAGAAGNAIAVAFYFAFCLAPAGYFGVRIFKRTVQLADGLLVLMSIILFVVIYMMVNPADIGQHLGFPEFFSTGKAFLGTVVYSVFVGYLIMRVLYAFKESGTGATLRYLKMLLAASCMVLVFSIFNMNLADLITSCAQVNGNSIDPMQGFYSSYMVPNTMKFDLITALNCLFLIFQYLVKILPFVLEIAIVFSGIYLITALEENPFGEMVAESARKTTQICRYSIVAVMLSQIGINILQFAFGSLVQSARYTLNIPLLSIVVMLAIMLLAGYFDQTRKLKHDNDMFI